MSSPEGDAIDQGLGSSTTNGQTTAADAVAADAVAAVSAATRADAADGDAELLGRLRRICDLLAVERPRVEAIAGAFIAEGRAFAATPEGRRCREALLRSELLPQARLLWEALGLRAARAGADTLLPSRWVGALVAASGNERAERLLSLLLHPGP